MVWQTVENSFNDQQRQGRAWTADWLGREYIRLYCHPLLVSLHMQGVVVVWSANHLLCSSVHGLWPAELSVHGILKQNYSWVSDFPGGSAWPQSGSHCITSRPHFTTNGSPSVRLHHAKQRQLTSWNQDLARWRNSTVVAESERN